MVCQLFHTSGFLGILKTILGVTSRKKSYETLISAEAKLHPDVPTILFTLTYNDHYHS